MSDGKKAAYEEEQLEASRAHLERAAKLTPADLVVLHARLAQALTWFRDDTPLTYGQHTAISQIREVRDALGSGRRK